ncbi:MAG: hypothetical protein JRE23_02810 [Deltaproteobacteria bacterium]|nr:hypothetical protein [Deltaproteobacteria bacterium]
MKSMEVRGTYTDPQGRKYITINGCRIYDREVREAFRTEIQTEKEEEGK